MRFVLACTCAVTIAGAQNIAGLRTMLEQAGLDGRAIQKLQAGQVVAMNLKARSHSELAVVGAAVIPVPREYFLGRFRDIARFEKGPQVLEVGVLSSPPTVADLTRLSLSSTDIAALRVCRPGDCKVKLSQAMMRQIETGMQGTAESAEGVDALYRAALIDYIRRFLADGNQALACYVDQRRRVCIARELRALLPEFSVLREYAPDLYDQLNGSVPAPPPGPNDFLYWSEEKVGPLKPMVSVTQVIIESNGRAGARESFIASKQIYASHYFRASLGVTVLADAGPNSVLMLYLNRSRFDGVGGGLGGLKRALLRHRLRSGMQQNLTRIRSRLEASWKPG